MEFCLVLNLTMGGKPAVTWPPIIVTRYVSFATIISTMSQVLATHKKSYFLTLVELGDDGG